jgi:citrate synthase
MTTLKTPVSTEVVRLVVNGTTHEFPIVIGSEGERAIDIGKLRDATGLITLDPGYGNTGSCVSAVSFIDGEQGILRYRGYPIEELAARSSFLEVCYLVLKGELPDSKQLADFQDQISHHSLLHEDMRDMYRGFPLDAHPMAVTSAVVGALSTFYRDSLDPQDDVQTELSTIRLLAKLPTICAWAYKHSIGQPFNYPRDDLGYSSNILHMMFATPSEPYVINPVFARAMELLLILHAEHEQNCSTSTMRMVGSSLANIYASASAAIMALWGPLHGGANQAVIEMLHDIADNGMDGNAFIARCKDRNDTTRLMGFGHRVYKNFDPRAVIIKQAAHDVLAELGKPTRLLEIALQLEDQALHDDYFVSRRLYPNVDFYSGLIYEALGIPTRAFTAFFTLGRMPGWIANFKEIMDEPTARIYRPRQVYTGPTLNHYVPIKNRK